MPRTTRVASSSDMPEGEDAGFQRAIKLLASQSRRERDLIVKLIFFWFSLPKRRRAGLARVLQPKMTDQDIAELVGVNRKTVGRWEEVKRARPPKTEHKPIKKKPSKRRRSKTGGWWPLDHPDGG